jgi:hypothetical protein
MTDLQQMDGPQRVPHLQSVLLQAVQLTLDQDTQLFSHGVHEQAVCHRIAVHLEMLLSPMRQMSIDCEYNRDVAEIKRYEAEFGSKRFRPDIVLHQRLQAKFNMLAIEAKRSDTGPEKLASDRRRIEVVMTKSRYGYDLGAFLELQTGCPPAKPGVAVQFYTTASGWTEKQHLRPGSRHFAHRRRQAGSTPQ